MGVCESAEARPVTGEAEGLRQRRRVGRVKGEEVERKHAGSRLFLCGPSKSYGNELAIALLSRRRHWFVSDIGHNGSLAIRYFLRGLFLQAHQKNK
jgi:hypothetical protein